MSEPVAVAAPGRRPPMVAVGTMVWLASELMFFSGLFAAWFTLRAAAGSRWPPSGVELDVARAVLFTVVLVASSATLQVAVRAGEHGDAPTARRWVLATLALGTVFVVNQALEWRSLEFTPSSHAYGSIFYLLTGFHGLHVIGGLAAMLAVLVRLAGPAGAAGPSDAAALQVVGYYWHFVDLVWIGVLATVFLVQ